MKQWEFGWLMATSALSAICGLGTAGEITLAKAAKAKVTIYSPVGPEATVAKEKAQIDRPYLRESVKDLAFYLEKMSGIKIEIVAGEPPAKAETLPFLIGELGAKQFGPPRVTSPSKQAFRVVVSKKAIACIGESDEAISYAIYEILDRLGCRWFMPGDMGEVIPKLDTISLPEMDVSLAPPMLYRNIWYASPDFKRRNRLGGTVIVGSHGLEGYISEEQRNAHPDWNAEFGGKRTPTGRICWGNPDVAQAVADRIIAALDKQYQPSVTLSPGDGVDFCECQKCKSLDTGDWDLSMACVSISDRLIHFCNQVAEGVTKKHPDVLFGLYAYVQFTRPPLREKPHPNIVIALAPITYCRAHSMANPECPSRQSLRPIVEGWGKVAHRLAFRGYLFNLAEVNAPYPMMALWSDEFPIYYANKVRFWMPESMPTFEGSLPGFYLNVRLPWVPTEAPARILDEFFTRFYGAAAEPMRRYWWLFDDAWTKVPEHAGCVFGHARRFTPETMASARKAMNEALATAKTAMVYRRVQFADASLKQFELFMKMRWDLADGRLANLEQDGNRWLVFWSSLQDRYAPESAFGRYQGDYFERFFMDIYRDGTRIAKDFTILGKPIRQWLYQVDKDGKAQQLGWEKSEFDDKAWKTTDPCVETWSALGLFEYFGSVWYRASVKLPAIPAGKKVFLWVACTDGSCKLFVNGRHVPYVNAKGETVEEFSGYSTPASFDITSAIKPGEMNQFTAFCTRPPGWINELGTGGLMGPVILYAER